jgi:Na+/phosphate symporter
MPVSIEYLSTEKQFKVAVLCSKVDSIDDLLCLKAYTKEVIRIAAVAGEMQEEMKEIILKLQASEKEMLNSIKYLEELIEDFAQKISG